MPAHPPGSRPPDTSRRRPVTAALVMLLLVCGLIPTISAEVIIDEEFAFFVDTGGTYSNKAATYDGADRPNFNIIEIKNIEKYPELAYIALSVSPHHRYKFKADGTHEFTYTGLGDTKTGRYHLETSRNLLGSVTGYRFVVFFDDWDIGSRTGTVQLTLSEPFYNSYASPSGVNTNPAANIRTSYNGQYESEAYTITIAAASAWKNRLVVDDNIPGNYAIDLQRIYDGKSYASTIDILKSSTLVFSEGSAADFWTLYPKNEIDLIKITALDKVYTVPLESSGEGSQASTLVTVYIQNSQTGALLADARLSILAATGGTETEIINATLPGGTGTYTLQPTGGGAPNPNYYRAVATVPGFSQIIENHSFTLTGPHDVIIEMRPDSGGPTDPDRCYLEFYVRDLNANPIPAASVQCDNRIKTTNSQGYTVFEVSKNSTYPYSARKTGYVTIEGTATVADGPRYVVNVVLGPGTVPTNPPATPPPGPGETPGATPTPDTRSSAEKAASGLDFLLDNAENFGIMAAMILLVYMGYWMVPKK